MHVSVSALLLLLLFAGIASADLDTLRNDAGAAAAAGNIDVAITKYREIIDQSPDDGAAHYTLGTLLMDNGGDLDDAIRHFDRAADAGFQPLGVAYRLSRIYARSGREAEAIEQLEIAAKGGFNLPGLIEGHADYATIEHDPRFESALEMIRAARFPCMSDERRHAFDFWIGKWDVTQNGQFAGTNDIQAILGDCVLLEQWESATGGKGKSFNYYDPGLDHWRQVWISDSGSVVEYTGEARDGGIFFTAETVDPADGSVTHHKFEFTRYDNGDVRQFWQTSTDGGENWSTIWDGRYARRVEKD